MRIMGVVGEPVTNGGAHAATCAWSPDGGSLAVNSPVGKVSIFRVRDLAVATEPAQVLEAGVVTAIRWLQDGRLFTIAGADPAGDLTVSVWNDPDSRTPSMRWHIPGPIHAWSADFSTHISVTDGDLICGEDRFALSTPHVERLCLSADGSTALIALAEPNRAHPPLVMSRDRIVPSNFDSVEIWNVSSGTRLHQQAAHLRVLAEAAISPDGRFYTMRGYYQGGDGSGDIRSDFRLYAPPNAQALMRDWGFFDDVPVLPTWSHEGNQLLCWAWKKTLTPPARPYLAVIDTVSGHQFAYEHDNLQALKPAELAWSPDKTRAAVCTHTATVHLYALTSPR